MRTPTMRTTSKAEEASGVGGVIFFCLLREGRAADNEDGEGEGNSGLHDDFGEVVRFTD